MDNYENKQVVEDLAFEAKTPDEEQGPAVDMKVVLHDVSANVIDLGNRMNAVVFFLSSLADSLQQTLARTTTMLRSKAAVSVVEGELDWEETPEMVVLWDTYVHSDLAQLGDDIDKLEGDLRKLTDVHDQLLYSLSRDIGEVIEVEFCASEAIGALESGCSS